MSIISQVKEGEYHVTTYDSGHIIKEIDQTGKVMPKPKPEPEPEPEQPDFIVGINKKLDEILGLLKTTV